MKQQYLYLVYAVNRHSGNTAIKLGFTTNPSKRLATLRQRNKHWEYSDMAVFKHPTKSYVKIDEQRIHEHFKRERISSSYSFSESPTEHYNSYMDNDIYNTLLKLGYVWVNQPVPQQVPQSAMFEWC
ncbi:GIY-YIG nuclease family protein [Escherichia coli]|uniref:GIY-YIG nuclease family protein n=1 Tax=Escherichia coli TaxID=562 RepID=UPI001261294F|nr:GIY-YIG nuclease family protein [Escherichia coli]